MCMCSGKKSSITKHVLSGALLAAFAAFPEALFAESDIAQMFYRLSFDGEPTAEGVNLTNDGGIGSVAAARLTDGYMNFGRNNGDGVTSPAESRFGSLNFRSNGAVPGIRDTANGLGLSGSDGFTLSFWIWPSSPTASTVQGFGFRLGAQNYRFEQQAKEIRLYPVVDANNRMIFGEMNFLDWNHICITIENGECKGYLNGVLGFTKELIAANQPEGILSEIIVGWGREEGSATAGLRNTKMPAWFDEAALFDKALSAEAVAWLFQNPADVPLLHPQVKVEADSILSAAQWSWPTEAPEELTNLSNLVITGSGARTLTIDQDAVINGTLTVLQSGSKEATDLIVQGEGSGFLQVNGNTVIRTDTLVRLGSAQLANVTLDPGKTLIVEGAATFTGDVLIPAGARLVLEASALPLTGLNSLTVEEGGILQLPFDGLSPVPILSSGTLVMDGFLFDREGNTIFGTYVDGIFVPDLPLVWDAESGYWGSHWWQTFEIPTDGKEVVFGDGVSGLATVDLTSTVSPINVTFANASTAYLFRNTGTEDFRIELPSSITGALKTMEAGAPVEIRTPVKVTQGIEISAGSELLLGAPFGNNPTASEGAVSAPITIAENAELIIDTPEGSAQTIGTAFTGNGTLTISGGGTVAFNQIVPNFTGQVHLSGATLRFNATTGDHGFFSNNVFDTAIPLVVSNGGTVEFNAQTVTSWLPAHRGSFFAEFGEGSTLKRTTTNMAESMTRGLRFTGSTTVIDQSTTNPWRFRSGITLKATAGTTTFTQVEGGLGFALFNDASSGATTATRTFFDIDAGAAIVFNSTLTDNANANSGLRKTGEGALILAGPVTHGRPSEIYGGTLTVNTTATGNGAYTIGNGTDAAKLNGTGSITGTGAVTVKNAATVETGLTINKLTLEDGAIIRLKDDVAPLATTTLTTTGSAIITVDIAAAVNDRMGKICDVLTWSETAPDATFIITGTTFKTFSLNQTPTSLELWRRQGTVISMY